MPFLCSRPTLDSLPVRVAAVVVTCLALAACGGEGHKPPIAQPLSLVTLEDTPIEGQLQATHPQGRPLTFAVDRLPALGVVQVNSATGAFSYQPAQDVNGTDSFTFRATGPGGAHSAPSLVTIQIEPVNDPPFLDAVPDQRNSAESLESRIPLVFGDVDGDALEINVASTNPSVATVDFDADSGALVVTPITYGSASIEVAVSDGIETISRGFRFEVADVARRLVVATSTPATAAVVVENGADRTARFVLGHNGFHVFDDADHMVSHIRALDDEIPDEPFERKLWRFLRDSTNHYYSLMPLQFQHSPWATVNSLGFGLCGELATSYVALAMTAGYEARVWSLGGHVVPEILVDGRWQVYDPDLAVYYRNRDGLVAGIAELQADPSLIREPVDPIFEDPGAWAYSDVVTGIYASTHDNVVADAALLPVVLDVGGRFELPAGARLTYPGRWTDEPIAYKAFGEKIRREQDLPSWREIAERHDGAVPYPIWFHRQARVDLPPGWTGEMNLPLWLWEIQGSGEVRIDDEVYTVGSDELLERLRYRVPPRSLTVLDSSGLSLIKQINFRRFDMRHENDVTLTGLDVWALSASIADIGTYGAGEYRRSNRPVATKP